MTRYECPVGPCKWVWDEPEPEPPGLYADPSAMLTALFVNAESVLRAHMGTHSLAEWVQQVTALRAELDREKRDFGVVAGLLLRRLGGSAFIGDGEMLDAHGTLQRTPVANGFVLAVSP